MTFNTDNIDRFGHCVICHNNLLTKRVVDGKVVDMFMPIYDETIFLLNNGSQMQVTICKNCKESTDLNDSVIHEQIMEAVQKGWQLETRIKMDQDDPEWSKEKRDKYIEHMSKLDIDCHSENLDKHVIQNRQMELLNLSVEEVK